MPSPYSIAILTDAPTEQLQRLAKAHNIPLLPVSQMPAPAAFDAYLLLTPQGLALQDAVHEFKPLLIDFMSDQLNYRKKFGGGKREPLAKAVGLKAKKNIQVLDVTAGLGRDAFILASLGCDVLMLERQPIMHALLEDALMRYKQSDQAFSLNLMHIDAIHYLMQLKPENFPDVIYLDPMYPHRTKAALVKKEMRLLRLLAGDDLDADALFLAAKNCARSRVVVKRPVSAASLGQSQPSMSIHGGKHRFDIYLTNLDEKSAQHRLCQNYTDDCKIHK